MAEERMLNDEILLGLIKANSGGGGGGTTDYDDLSNKPKIGGVTLSGNKSASDLGLATTTDLAGKQDTLTFDSVPTDGSTNPVESNGVYDALAGKQNVFTSGDYLEMANGVLNVTKNKGNDLYSYKFITTSTSDQPRVKIQRYINGVFQSEETYNNDNVRVNPVTLDGLFTFTYGLDGYRWQYTLLANSHQHNAGEVVKWMYNVSVDSTESFDVVPQDTSKNLVLQEDLDAALATKANASDVTTALATKQDATDNNLTTTSKTVVGAVNELKSGLTDLSEEVNGDATTYPYADVITIEDAIPANVADCSVKIEPVQDLHGQSAPYVGGAGKNKLPLTVANLKTYNTSGTWSDHVYTVNGVTFTVNTDDGGNVIGIKASGTASAFTVMLVGVLDVSTGDILNGCPAGGDTSRYCINTYNTALSEFYGRDTGDGLTFDRNINDVNVFLSVQNGYEIPTGGLTFYPMIRLATETDATFAPYTNICPISGHTEASVQRDGKNWFDENDVEIGTAWNGNANADRARIIIPCKPNTTYTFSMNGVNNTDLVVYGWFKSTPALAGNVSFPQTFTTESDSKYIVFGFNKTSISKSDIELMKLQLEEGSTATPYVPYAGKTYTISLGDTIYGGTVDFDSGVMTVDRAIMTIPTIESYGGVVADTDYNYKNLEPSEQQKLSNSDVTVLGEALKGISYNDRKTMPFACFGSTSTKRITVTVASDYSIADFNANIAGTKLCYLLETPFTVQLTPQQIQLLKGQNTLTASTGQISVTVNGVSGAIGQVQEQVNATDAALAELADKLPTAPTTDGAYVLTVTVADGTPTYSWESAT